MVLRNYNTVLSTFRSAGRLLIIYLWNHLNLYLQLIHTKNYRQLNPTLYLFKINPNFRIRLLIIIRILLLSKSWETLEKRLKDIWKTLFQHLKNTWREHSDIGVKLLNMALNLINDIYFANFPIKFKCEFKWINI